MPYSWWFRFFSGDSWSHLNPRNVKFDYNENIQTTRKLLAMERQILSRKSCTSKFDKKQENIKKSPPNGFLSSKFHKMTVFLFQIICLLSTSEISSPQNIRRCLFLCWRIVTELWLMGRNWPVRIWQLSGKLLHKTEVYQLWIFETWLWFMLVLACSDVHIILYFF